MSLTDLPTVKPSETSVFLIALPLIIFIFFFTQFKTTD